MMMENKMKKISVSKTLKRRVTAIGNNVRLLLPNPRRMKISYGASRMQRI